MMSLKSLLTGKKNSWKKKISIHSAEELLELAKKVNYSRNNCDHCVIELECDIDLYDKEWEPIGNTIDTPFCGEFDGKNHTIRGLHLETSNRFVGLFGIIRGAGPMKLAEIRNLRLEEFEIYGTENTSWTGGITGFAGEGVLIENCRLKGTVRSWSFVGGILGVADGSVGIRECYVEGIVAGENVNEITLRNNVAGAIAGKFTSDSILRDCHNKVLNSNGLPLQNQVGKFDDTLYIEVSENQTAV